MANSQDLLARLLRTPDLPAIVPRLQPEILHRVIEACGLEDCSEFVALASPAQLARVLDLDLWRARTPGAEEQFDAHRFGVWLAVLLDAGPDVAADKLTGLDVDLVAAGLARHLVVSDHAAVAGFTTLDGEQIPGRVPAGTQVSHIGGYVLEARLTSAWDAIVELLSFLGSDRPGYFHRLMRACVRLSDGPREDDASHHLLEDAEQHVFDLAADRETRRERQGYVTPAQAHAFLRAARDVRLDCDRPPASPIAGAYFRAFEPDVPESDTNPDTDASGNTVLDASSSEAVLELLRDEGVIARSPAPLLGAGDPTASRLSCIESHVAANAASVEELAYLANALVAGCGVQGRPFTEREAGDLAVSTCNLGLENWPPQWADRDLVTAFQVGWAVLYREVCVYAAKQLIEVLADVQCSDRDTWLRIDRLRRDLSRHVAIGEPWHARGALDAILALDPPAWAALLGLIDECPVRHAALDAAGQRRRAISPTDFSFISRNSDIAAIREFMASLPSALSG